MFLAYELRQVAADTPPANYVVVKAGRVFDASRELWDQGLDWAVPLSALRWRAPGAVRVPWQPALYQESQQAICGQLQSWGTEYAQPDVRRGWVRIARPTPRDWDVFGQALVPRWAGWMRAGIAPHPLLAQWVARAGTSLALPVWRVGASVCAVCDPAQASSVWATFPLAAVPPRWANRERWRQLNWHRVGEVPGLATLLARSSYTAAPAPPEVSVQRVWADPLVVGQRQVWVEMAQVLASRLRQARWLAFGLRITWEGERQGPIQWQRRWPTASQDAATLLLRILNVIRPQSVPPPIRVVIAADELEAAPSQQMRWWPSAARPAVSGVPDQEGLPSEVLQDSAREVRLAMWDPWRSRRP